MNFDGTVYPYGSRRRTCSPIGVLNFLCGILLSLALL